MRYRMIDEKFNSLVRSFIHPFMHQLNWYIIIYFVKIKDVCVCVEEIHWSLNRFFYFGLNNVRLFIFLFCIPFLLLLLPRFFDSTYVAHAKHRKLECPLTQIGLVNLFRMHRMLISISFPRVAPNFCSVQFGSIKNLWKVINVLLIEKKKREQLIHMCVFIVFWWTIYLEILLYSDRTRLHNISNVNQWNESMYFQKKI